MSTDLIQNIPDNLIEKIKEQYDQNVLEDILKGYNSNRYVTLRVNNILSSKTEILNFFESNMVQYSTVPWYDNAFIILNKDEKYFEETDIYSQGKIYIQSLSSMLPPIMLDPKENEDILDMCAAPGGKTSEIAALTNNKAHITACEMNNVRIEKLKFNIEKQRVKNINIMNIDSRKLDDYFSFDKILIDAPCSGTGTITKKDKIQYTDEFANKLEKTQLALLEKGIKLLKRNGELIYSTCSILERENENIIQKVLNKKNVEIVDINKEVLQNVPKLPCKIPGCICVHPNEYYEGFFVAKLKKI